ncbi:hypothetical protein J5277_29360 [Rhizobium sp. 16-449-1b]|uniref:hypothetical protein n=1 Tax=Rhizobium sp. 16-449-1b TaxID=2819989 RepID=UPI001ADC7C0F|nr:hypothetical protein [Rhizobium sp. 16-449-1b]MBO9198243.1 hypothetical protein [Rhizobium sp. 16-449-1b]
MKSQDFPATIPQAIDDAPSPNEAQINQAIPSKGGSKSEMDDSVLLRRATRWLVILGATMFGAVFLVSAAFTIYSQSWVVELAREHFAATVGLPFAALAALCLVIILEISSGTIQIKGLGFEFKGAGGPLVMWIFCFLAIASAIKILW